jgi:hypothetical protein
MRTIQKIISKVSIYFTASYLLALITIISMVSCKECNNKNDNLESEASIFTISVNAPLPKDKLIGIEEGIFTLKNITSTIINPAEIEIELQSNNGALFNCKDAQGYWPDNNKPQTLETILGNNIELPYNIETPGIQFGVINPHGEKESKITIIVRRNGNKVARTTELITWKALKKHKIKPSH